MAHIPNRAIDFTAVISDAYVGTGVDPVIISPAGLGEDDAIVAVDVFSTDPGMHKSNFMAGGVVNVEGSGITADLITLSGNTFVVESDANIVATTYYYIAYVQLK